MHCGSLHAVDCHTSGVVQELLAAPRLAEPIIVLNTATVHQTVAYNKTGSSGSEFLCALDAVLFTVTDKPSHAVHAVMFRFMFNGQLPERLCCLTVS